MSLFDKYKKTADKTTNTLFGDKKNNDFITVAFFIEKGGILTPDTLLYHNYRGGEIDSCGFLRHNNIVGREDEFYLPVTSLPNKPL